MYNMVDSKPENHRPVTSLSNLEFVFLALPIVCVVTYVVLESLLIVYRYLYLIFAVTVLKVLWGEYTTELRGGNRRCVNTVSLSGKTVVMTGGTTGTGRAAAYHLACRGARIILGCRNLKRAESVVQELRKGSGNNNIFHHKLDLLSFKSIREFADKLRRDEEEIDILINNACISDFSSHDNQKIPHFTVDGLTHSFQVNYWGHFLLTNLLLKLMVKSTPSRIINVTSRLHMKPQSMNFDVGSGKMLYPRLTGYPLGKLANVLFTRELALRLEGSGVKVYAVDPGLTFWKGRNFQDWKAKMMLPFLWLIMSSEDAASQTTVFCATEKGLQNGEVYFDCRPSKYVNYLVNDVILREKLWDTSLEVTQLSIRRNGKTTVS